MSSASSVATATAVTTSASNGAPAGAGAVGGPSGEGTRGRGRRSTQAATLLAGLDPAIVLPESSRTYACPLCPDLRAFDSQRAYTKHMQAHQRAFDEEELRSGKGATTLLAATPYTQQKVGKKKRTSVPQSLADLLRAHGAVPSKRIGAKAKQVVRRGHSSADASDEEEQWGAPAAAAAPPPSRKKSKKKSDQPAVEEVSLSDEERRQSALRREQKKLNMAAAAAGVSLETKPTEEEEEEEVRCCLCHQADSDEYNPIVMCDGPCDMPFHAECWGIEHIPKGKWFCSASCKAGRRIDRVEHLGAHRIRFQRRRRQLLNQHNSREQAMLNDFWGNTVEPYFNARFLTQHGAELLAPTELTRDILEIPARGRHFVSTWIEEDELAMKSTGRHARATNRAAADVAIPVEAAPASSSLVSATEPAAAESAATEPKVATSPLPVGPSEFASASCARLHQYLDREPSLVAAASAEEIAEMERIASKPHTASVSVLAYISSTAVKVEPAPVEEPEIIDPDVRPPFDRSSYYFPSSHHRQWSPPPGVLKRATDEAPEAERAALAAAAKVIFDKATPATAKELTGAHKDKAKPKPKPATGPPTLATIKPDAKPSAAPMTPQPAASLATSSSPAIAVANPTPASSLPIASALTAPVDATVPATAPAAAAASTPVAASASTHVFTAASDVRLSAPPVESIVPDEVEHKSRVKQEPVEEEANGLEMEAEEKEDEPMEEKRRSPLASPPSALQSTPPPERPSKGGKQSRNAALAAALDVDSSAAAAASSSRPIVPVSGKAPAAGGKAPRDSAKAGQQSGKAPRQSNPKPTDAKPKQPRADASDEDEGESGGSDEEEEEEDESMTYSEEEDMRAEHEELAAAAAEAESLGGHGLGAGKGPGAHVPAPSAAAGKAPVGAGKQPRGSAPVASERVMAPRRDEPATEEIALEPVEEIDAVATLPSPYFDFRTVDSTSLPELSMKLPKTCSVLAQHDVILDKYPFLNAVHPALLAASCHYSLPPLLYSQHTSQLTDVTLEDGTPLNDVLDATAADVHQRILDLNAALDIVEVSKQHSLAELLPPPQPPLAAAPVVAFPTLDESPVTELVKVELVVKPEEDFYGAKFTTTASSRRECASARADADSDAAVAAAAAAAYSSSIAPLGADAIEVDTTAALPLVPSSHQLASLSVSPEYDDEVSAELWLAQRQYFLQVNHNNYVRSYLSERAHASGDWKADVAQIDQKAAQDKATMEIYDEAQLLGTARQQRETRRQKFAMSEAGQIRHIVRSQRAHLRNQRQIQRLLKSMVTEVERREKKRQVNERRSVSVAQREAKRQRREAQEAQWKNRREAEIYHRCENALDRIIRQIERQVEGRASKPRKPRDPNAPKRSRKKKTDGEDPNVLYCICRTPYDNDRFYLGCDNCGGWFHGKCVGVTEGQAEGIADYICPECEKVTGKVTTYTDAKHNRASRHQKLKADAEAEAESSSAPSSSSEEEEELAEYIRPIILRKLKTRRGKLAYTLVEHASDEEEGSGSGSGSDSGSGSEDEEGSHEGSSSEETGVGDMDISDEDVSSAEEDEGEDGPIRIQRLVSNAVRLRRLPDAAPPEISTRKKLNLKRYEFVDYRNWEALHLPHTREQTASAHQILHRFRRYPSLYRTTINEKMAVLYGVTRSRLRSQKPKRKFSSYAYRYHTFQFAGYNSDTGVLYIRKHDPAEASPEKLPWWHRNPIKEADEEEEAEEEDQSASASAMANGKKRGRAIEPSSDAPTTLSTEPPIQRASKRARGAPSVDVDADDGNMSDVPETPASGTGGRRRATQRGSSSDSNTSNVFVLKRGGGGSDARVLDAPKVTPFSLSALKQAAAACATPTPSPSPPGGRRSGRTSSPAPAPVASLPPVGLRGGTRSSSRATPIEQIDEETTGASEAAATPLAPTPSRTSKRKREVEDETAASDSAAATVSSEPTEDAPSSTLTKKSRRGPTPKPSVNGRAPTPSSASEPTAATPTNTTSAAESSTPTASATATAAAAATLSSLAPVFDALDLVKTRTRNPVKRYEAV